MGRGFPPHPTPFLCLAKEKGEKKGDPGAAPYACGFGYPALLESQGRPGMARRLRRRLAVAEISLTFCDARRATRGKRRAKHNARCNKPTDGKHHVPMPSCFSRH